MKVVSKTKLFYCNKIKKIETNLKYKKICYYKKFWNFSIDCPRLLHETKKMDFLFHGVGALRKRLLVKVKLCHGETVDVDVAYLIMQQLYWSHTQFIFT